MNSWCNNGWDGMVNGIIRKLIIKFCCYLKCRHITAMHSAQWAKTEHKIPKDDEKNVGKLRKVPAYIWTLFPKKHMDFNRFWEEQSPMAMVSNVGQWLVREIKLGLQSSETFPSPSNSTTHPSNIHINCKLYTIGPLHCFTFCSNNKHQPFYGPREGGHF